MIQDGRGFRKDHESFAKALEFYHDLIILSRQILPQIQCKIKLCIMDVQVVLDFKPLENLQQGSSTRIS